MNSRTALITATLLLVTIAALSGCASGAPTVASVGLLAAPPRQPPLIQAIAADDSARVASLLQGGANPNVRDIDGYPALMHATALGHKDMVELLIEHGADVNVRDPHERTALSYALSKTQPNIALMLLARGAQVNAGEPAGATPLCWAADQGLLGVMPELLARRADINGDVHDSSRPRDRGCNPLADAANKDTAAFLIDHGADLHRVPWVLVPAAARGHVDHVEYLISLGSDVNAVGLGGSSPLHAVANQAVARVLVERGADINARDGFFCTPLYRALQSQHTDVVAYLQSLGAESGCLHH